MNKIKIIGRDMIKNKNSGFTLIEIMIVVAILGIATAMALPSYTEYVRKGKRADAKVELLRMAQLQESYFVQNLSYASTLTQLGFTGTVKSEQGEYEIKLPTAGLTASCDGTSVASCTEYQLLAEGLGAQASDKCGDFTITNTGVKNVVGATSPYDGPTCWK